MSDTDSGLDATTRQAWLAARPDLDLSSMEIVGAIRHAAAMVEALVEPVFATAQVSSSEFDILFHLRHAAEPIIARRLAARMGRSSAALSKSLTKLEQRGLVLRTESRHDRRAALVSITAAGTTAIDELMPSRLAMETAALEGLTAKRRKEVTEAITLLTGLLEAQARLPLAYKTH